MGLLIGFVLGAMVCVAAWLSLWHGKFDPDMVWEMEKEEYEKLLENRAKKGE